MTAPSTETLEVQLYAWTLYSDHYSKLRKEFEQFEGVQWRSSRWTFCRGWGPYGPPCGDCTECRWWQFSGIMRDDNRFENWLHKAREQWIMILPDNHGKMWALGARRGWEDADAGYSNIFEEWEKIQGTGPFSRGYLAAYRIAKRVKRERA